MCILCVASRWSRRVATMLPWLILPFIILWALSQLLPSGYRFEVTSSRLACVGVLLLSLGWYELAMPKLSSWRARRGAIQRERRRVEAIEAAKWRKEATRRCRNCLTPYRDQSPGGGKFMCTYCGHVSRRPVLDLPSAPSSSPLAISIPPASTGSNLLVNSGMIAAGSRNLGRWGDKVGEGGSLTRWNWIGSKSWSTITGVSGSWFGNLCSTDGTNCLGDGKNWGSTAGCNTFEGIFVEEKCSSGGGESYSGALSFVLRLSWQTVSWVLTKFGRVGRLDNGLSGGSGHMSFPRKPDDESAGQESRAEKARRKAEEKRQVRLEKELLEAEERKVRDEVTRLVEERRRLRDEKLEAEKESEKEAAAEREREVRREKEAERRRQEKAREREKGMIISKDKLKEEDKKLDLERGEKELKGPMSNCGELRKSVKAVKGTGQENAPKAIDLLNKGVPTNSSKAVGTTRLLGSSKTSAFTPVKNSGSFWTRGLSTGTAVGAKIGKMGAVNVTYSSSSTASGKVSQASTSAWNRIMWPKVWGKGLPAVENDPNMPGVIEASSTKADQLSVGTEVKTPVSPSIAAPSSQAKSWLELFSGPTSSSEINLSTEHLETRAHCSSPSHPIHFSTVHSTVVLPCDSESEVVSLPGVTSDPVVTSLPTPNSLLLGTHLDVNKTEESNRNDLQHHHSSDDLLNRSPPSIKYNPLSPIHGPVSAPMSAPSPIQSNAVKLVKSLESNMHMDSHPHPQILEPWRSTSSPSDDSNAAENKGQWQLWGDNKLGQIDLPCLSLILPPSDGLNSSQPLSSSASHSQLEPELPTYLFSPQHTSPFVDQRKGELIGRCPPLSSSDNGIWSDPLALGSARRIWQDTETSQDRVPVEFLDLKTQMLMKDPVIIADGFSYERSSIEDWLKLNDTSPKTGESLPDLLGGFGVDKTLRPNHILRGQIIEYKEKLARDSALPEGASESGWNANSGSESSPSWQASSRGVGASSGTSYYSSGGQSFWSYNMP